jgi:hypothetical protein
MEEGERGKENGTLLTLELHKTLLFLLQQPNLSTIEQRSQ